MASNNRNKKKPAGIRIGSVTIRPAGIALFVLLIALIAVIVALLVTGSGDGIGKPKLTPTPEPTFTPEPTNTPVPTPVPTATPIPEPRVATIRSLGEIALENEVLASAAESSTSFSFDDMFAGVKDVIGNADYTIATLEGTLTAENNVSGTTTNFTSPVSILSTLKDCGVDALAMANDHMLDNGFDGLATSVNAIRDAGFTVIGAGASSDETLPVVETVNGIKIGFVGYTVQLQANVKKADKSKLQYCAHYVLNSDCLNDIRNAKIAGAEVIIAYMSWGDMFSSTPNADQYNYAKLLAQAGADIIIGYNPLTVQPAEWISGTNEDGSTYNAMCVYATGAMLSNQTNNYANTGVILEFTLREADDFSGFSIENVHYIPTYALRTENDTSNKTVLSTTDTAAAEDAAAEPAEDAAAADEAAADEAAADDEVLADDALAADDTFGLGNDTADTTAGAVSAAPVSSAAKNSSAAYCYRVLTIGDWISDDASLHLLNGMTVEDIDKLIDAWVHSEHILGTSVGVNVVN